MYGVPGDLDLTAFIGTTLDYVGMGRHQLSFAFSGDPRTEKDRVVTAEGHWEVRDAQSAVIDKAMDHEDRDAFRIHHLLGRTVIRANVNAPESFTLVFDNGWTLTFVDSSSQYESCHIYLGETEIRI